MITPNGKNLLTLSALFAASAVLLSIIQPPIGLSACAWVAYVPFALACSPKVKIKPLIITSYIISLCYWLVNLYWIIPVTIAGWFAFCAYTALLWPLLAITLRFCSDKKFPFILSMPLLIVGAERLQGFLLGGFFWRFLAHSQYSNITLIQIADIFGAAGISFLIAMVNALIANSIAAGWQKKINKKWLLLKTAIVIAALTASLLYGKWRIEQTDKNIEIGPVIGALQSNIPQSIKSSTSDEINEQTFNTLIQESQKIINTGADLTIWPETVVPAILDRRITRIIEPNSTHKKYDNRLRQLSKNSSYHLVGASGAIAKIQNDRSIELTSRYNSAFLYTPQGNQSYKQYDKIHLVPFGEFVPFRKKLPWLYDILMKFTPYDYDYNLDPGDEYTIFDIKENKGQGEKIYKFSVMICYEDTIPAIARRFTLDEFGQKRIHWLVNISNDGWFVRFKDDKAYPSTELAQHAAVCAFRAIENRLAVLRSVNTGISCLIDSTGKIRDGFLEGNLPYKALKRTGMTGWFVDKMPIDKRVTIFSKYGGWIDIVSATFFVAVILIALIKQKNLALKEKKNRRLK